MNSTKHTKEPRRRFWPAYAFGDAQFFKSLTKFIVTHLPNDGKAQTASAKYGIPKEIENHLPDSLLGKFSRQAPSTKVIRILTLTQETIFLAERAIKTEVQIHLEQIISPIASKRPTGDFIPAADDTLLSHCDRLSISSLITALSRQGPWPPTSAVHRLSISTLCRKLGACDFGSASRITKMIKVRALSGGGGGRQGGADQRGRVDGVRGVVP